MNKSDMADALSDKLRIGKKEAAAAIEAIFSANGGIIMTALHKGDHVSISGFGSFEMRKRAARSARNPKTGQSVLVPEKVSPVFRPSKSIKGKPGRTAS